MTYEIVENRESYILTSEDGIDSEVEVIARLSWEDEEYIVFLKVTDSATDSQILITMVLPDGDNSGDYQEIVEADEEYETLNGAVAREILPFSEKYNKISATLRKK